MRIAVDHSAAFNQGAGIGRYARNLVPAALDALPEADLTLFYAPEPNHGARFSEDAIASFGDPNRVRVVRGPFDRRRMDQLWFRLRAPIPLEFWTGFQDLVYSPDFTAPPSWRAPRIVTVHDLAFEIVPERAPVALRRYLSAVVPRQVRSAAAVVAVSETTKHDLVQRLGVSPERVTVIPNAADERFFAATPLTEAERSALGLPERFMLTVGTIEPRKNHFTLFAALDLVPLGERLPLVVVGKRGWDTESVLERAAPLQAAGRVILLDYVEDRLLPGLYASATAVVYPSWYEGFGLPVLEGLAAGVHVIASDVPVHREVAGDVATFVAPGDHDAFARAIADAGGVMAEDAGAKRARRERARRYSWDSSGAALANLFRAVGTP